MNITKAEALQKIADLQRYIEELDKPIDWKVGDVFLCCDGSKISILNHGHGSGVNKRFVLGGLGLTYVPYDTSKTKERFLHPYANVPMSAHGITDYLKENNAKKIGELVYKEV